MTDDNTLKNIIAWCDQFELNDGHTQALSKNILTSLTFLQEEVRETRLEILDFTNNHETQEKAKLEAIIDGFGDVLFVSLNAIYKIFRGMNDDHSTAQEKTLVVINRIVKANYDKLHNGKVVKDHRGKVVKPYGWSPPAYSDLL